jgi:hypothetical protein
MLSASTAGQPSAHDILTLLWISALMTVIGGVLAFDVRGIATSLHEQNSGFTPWGKRLKAAGAPNPGKVVGWVFFTIGAPLLLLSLIGGLMWIVGLA